MKIYKLKNVKLNIFQTFIILILIHHFLYKIVMLMYCHYKFLEVMYWYRYNIFGNVLSNVILLKSNV